MRLLWLLVLLPGCSFDASGVGGDLVDAGGEVSPDAGSPSDGGDLPGIDAMVTPPACPADYAATDDSGLPHRYRFDDTDRDRTAAVADCADDTPGWTHLVIIDSTLENEYVDEISGDRTVWMVISDESTEGTWTTPTGAVQTYFHWGAFQPDNFFNQDFAVLQNGGNWNDIDPGSGNRSVCECDLTMARTR